MTIGERIKHLRTSLGMTQDELAKLIGYKSRSSIQKIESGERDITQSTIVAFAKALKTTPGELMGWGRELSDLDDWKSTQSEHNEDIKIVARHLEEIPREKRSALIKTISSTIDMYKSAIGLDKDKED